MPLIIDGITDSYRTNTTTLFSLKMVHPINSVEKPIVYIVDSNHVLLDSLSKHKRLSQVVVEVFDSAESFLQRELTNPFACLIVEVNLPQMGGIELLERLNNQGICLPSIVLSSKGNVSEAVRAMQAQAIDFIEKPFIENTLVARILDVLEKD